MAILTEPDDEGHQHPVAHESSKHVLELPAVIHSLRAFRHYLLGPGCRAASASGLLV